jgi:hypothetical protein
MDVWNYKLCNRYALDGTRSAQGREIPTILEKFDIYRFTDYKEKVIDLLARVTSEGGNGAYSKGDEAGDTMITGRVWR